MDAAVRFEHPVFGPDRPAAAAAAITDLRAAQDDLVHCDADWGSACYDTLTARVAAAHDTRAMYAEYGDTFHGH